MVGAHGIVDQCLDILERKTNGVVGEVIDLCESGDRGIQFVQSFVDGCWKLDVIELLYRSVDVQIRDTHGMPTKKCWDTIEIGDEGVEIAFEAADTLGEVPPNSP